MTKKYNTPMLTLVRISQKDIIATSLRIGNALTVEEANDGFIYAGSADRFRDWDN